MARADRRFRRVRSMIHPVRSLVGGLALLGLLLGGWPAMATAASITFRNDTSMPVIVRGVSVVNRQVRQGAPHLLQPGDSCADPILFPGQKLITVYDAKQPARPWFQGTISCAGSDPDSAI